MKLLEKKYVKFGIWMLFVAALMVMKKDAFEGGINQTEVFYYGRFLLTILVLTVAGVILFLPIPKFKYSIENMFLVVAALSGVLLAFANPPLQECDGWEHFVRVVDVSYGEVLQPFVNLQHSDNTLKMPANYQDLYTGVLVDGKGNAYEYRLKNTVFADETIEIDYPSSYVSLFYLPQGIGLAVARLMGVGVYWGILLGRLLNLCVYLALTYFALKLMPIMKNVFAVIALLPMSVYQAASFSPDSMLHGLCFLFTALCFYYAYRCEKKITWKQMLPIGIVLALIFMCKYVYVCMGLLVFMIPAKKFENRKEYWKAFVIALLPIALCVGALIPTFGSSVGLMTAEDAGMTQMQFVMHNPLKMIRILLSTLEAYFVIFIDYLNTLGALSYGLGPLTMILPCFFVLVVCLDAGQNKVAVKTKDKLLCVMSFGITTVLMLMGLYLGDGRINEVGAEIIRGGQGRYFIPLMYLGAIVFANSKVENKMEHFSRKVIACMAAMLGLTGIMLMAICYHIS